MDKISALMDGELDAHQSSQQYTRLAHDADARASWNAYHMIGDTMRGDRVISPGFSARVGERLAQEPTVLAPQRRQVTRATAYALSAAASLTAVALVAWIALNNPLAPQPETVATSAPGAVVPAPAPAPEAPVQMANLPSDGKMNEYLMAHQGVSPTVLGVAPYIRTVSATQSPKGRE